eukprot:NODE_263_length_11363_cov_0.749556.p4 type:complete len:255 gc:universal NODE_263_length_11363_cov_0.749556:6270-7034(+)
MLLFCLGYALTDCQNLKQFAINLNMNIANPTTMNQITNNFCTGIVDGVVCNNGVIESISWVNYGLSGSFKAYLPSQLISLNLESNQITGSLPTAGYPSTLKSFSVLDNKLSGIVPKFPDGLDSLTVDTNQFTSFGVLPANLTYFNANVNLIKRTFPNNLPKNLVYLRLQSNQISGTLSNLPSSLIEIDICGNNIGGTIPKLPPNLVNFNACINQFKNIIYPLPNTLQRTNMYYNMIQAPVILPPNIQAICFMAN